MEPNKHSITIVGKDIAKFLLLAFASYHKKRFNNVKSFLMKLVKKQKIFIGFFLIILFAIKIVKVICCISCFFSR